MNILRATKLKYGVIHSAEPKHMWHYCHVSISILLPDYSDTNFNQQVKILYRQYPYQYHSKICISNITFHLVQQYDSYGINCLSFSKINCSLKKKCTMKSTVTFNKVFITEKSYGTVQVQFKIIHSINQSTPLKI